MAMASPSPGSNNLPPVIITDTTFEALPTRRPNSSHERPSVRTSPKYANQARSSHGNRGTSRVCVPAGGLRQLHSTVPSLPPANGINGKTSHRPKRIGKVSSDHKSPSSSASPALRLTSSMSDAIGEKLRSLEHSLESDVPVSRNDSMSPALAEKVRRGEAKIRQLDAVLREKLAKESKVKCEGDSYLKMLVQSSESAAKRRDYEDVPLYKQLKNQSDGDCDGVDDNDIPDEICCFSPDDDSLLVGLNETDTIGDASSGRHLAAKDRARLTELLEGAELDVELAEGPNEDAPNPFSVDAEYKQRVATIERRLAEVSNYEHRSKTSHIAEQAAKERLAEIDELLHRMKSTSIS